MVTALGLDQDIETLLIVAEALLTLIEIKAITDTIMPKMQKKCMSVSIAEGTGIVREEMIAVLQETIEVMTIDTVVVMTTMAEKVAVTTVNEEIVVVEKKDRVEPKLNFHLS